MSNTQKDEETATFEAAMEKLQATVKRIESGELSLEESLKHFEEGVRLTRLCQERLSAAEKRVEILMNSKPELQPFQSHNKG